jgi:DNA-binding NarL/FixJ family response regulator
MTIRILIADDHAVVAEGLKHVVETQPDMEVVSLAVDGREALRQARELTPDVVLMDLSMPELNGADATRAILERDPRCRVIVLSMYAEREYVRRALKAGAAGYVVKRSAAKEVVEAIRAVYAGQRYLSARIADVVIGARARGAAAPRRGAHRGADRGAPVALAEDGRDLPCEAGGEARHPRRRRPGALRHPARHRFARLTPVRFTPTPVRAAA